MTTEPAESRAPAPKVRRRLSVLDLTILVAALAAGFAGTRSLPDYLEWYDDVQIYSKITTNAAGSSWSMSGVSFRVRAPYNRKRAIPSLQRASYWLGHVPYWSGPCLASLTVASTALALRRPKPRPRLSRLARRPGLAVGLALILALAVKIMHCAQYAVAYKPWLSTHPDRWQTFAAFGGISVPPLVGYTVAALWLAQVLTGRWSSELNPGGRLCQLLGWCWIAMALSGEIGGFCYNLDY